MNVKGLVQTAGKAIQKGAPTILTCIGAAGVATTAILTGKAAVKAASQTETDCRHDDETSCTSSFWAKVKSSWYFYIPAAISGLATIGCIFGANILNRRQQAALMSAYAFLHHQYVQYKNSAKEVLGEEGEAEVMKHIVVESPNPPAIYGSLFGEPFDFGDTDDEKHLFYDVFSDRYFDAKISDVLLAELHTNRNFAINGGEIPLHHFYDFLGLDTPEELKSLSWYWSESCCFIDFTHHRVMIDDGPDHEPVECWVIDMPFPPIVEPLE